MRQNGPTCFVHPGTQFKNQRQPLKTLVSRAHKGVYLVPSRPQVRVVTDQRGPVRHEWESVGTRLTDEMSKCLADDFQAGMIVADLSSKYGVRGSRNPSQTPS